VNVITRLEGGNLLSIACGNSLKEVIIVTIETSSDAM